MTPDEILERRLKASMAGVALSGSPDYLDSILSRSRRTRQRPARFLWQRSVFPAGAPLESAGWLDGRHHMTPMLRIAAVAALAVAVGTGVIGLRSATNVSTPGPSPSVIASPAPSHDGALAGLATEEVQPGVLRIVSDDAGHDLDARHPINTYDLDAIAVADDGTVWLSTSYNGTDNDANPDGPHLWALGRPGMLGLSDGYQGAPFLVPLPDGSLLLIGHRDQGVIRFDGIAFQPDAGLIARPIRRGATLWLIGRDRLATLVGDDADAPRPDVDLAVIDTGDGWVTLSDTVRRVQANGWSCEATAAGVVCEDLRGRPRRYLAGTPIHQIATAPDGSVWAVGGGKLYRISVGDEAN